MTDTKTCTYKSCKDVFERPANTPDGTWKQLSRCPKCRKKAHMIRAMGSKQPGTAMGRYEVNNQTIDLFLYGQ